MTYVKRYFKLLLNQEWRLKNWDGPEQYEVDGEDASTTKQDLCVMMERCSNTTVVLRSATKLLCDSHRAPLTTHAYVYLSISIHP